jgi:hypothetical protein
MRRIESGGSAMSQISLIKRSRFQRHHPPGGARLLPSLQSPVDPNALTRACRSR